MSPPNPDRSDAPPSDRIARAVRIALAYRESGRVDAEVLLAEHADIAELLAPMLSPEAGSAGDTDHQGDHVEADGPWSAMPVWPIGMVVDDYRIDGLLGQGGMGTVLLATQLRLGRPVALKVLHQRGGALPERARWRFQRESRLLAELDHPNIVKVFGAGEHDGVAFYAMECIDGASLRQVLASLGRGGLPQSGRTLLAAIAGFAPSTMAAPPPAPMADCSYVQAMATIGAELAEALASAHALGIVHRDIKPANVLLRRTGQALLADFGIARREDGPSLTLTGDIAGTPYYMSPEQARGEQADQRSDQFSLGVLLYEALTLRRPFDGETTLVVLDRLQRDEPVEPRLLNPAIPRELAAVVLRAMAKSAVERYPNVGELAADLRAWLRGDPVRAVPPSRWQRLRRWARREPWRATAVAVAGAGLLVVAVGSALFTRELLAEGKRTAAALRDVQRLGLGVRLERAQTAAEAFALARIESVPAMQSWLRDEAEPLVAEIPSLASLLATVRERAEPYDATAALADRDGHRDAGRLSEIDLEVAASRRQAEAATDAEQRQVFEQHLVTLQSRREELVTAMSVRRTWRFRDPQQQFLHDQILTLLERLRHFGEHPQGARQRVHEQIAWAQESHRRCQTEAAAAWLEAAAGVRADARFDGLRLAPQWDLLPLGADPASGLWEFLHLRSGACGKERPQRGADGRLVIDESSGIVFVLLPGGTFAMGAQKSDPTAPNHDPDCRDYEQPVHPVTLAPFFVSKHELTVAQWQRLSGGERPGNWVDSPRLRITDRHPVESVSCRRATAVLAGHGLLLPTEAQWEYAARAGSQRKWFWERREEAPRFANFGDEAARRAGANWSVDAGLDDGSIVHGPVGSYAANAFGLHDMLGNVSELTRDRTLFYTRPVRAGDGLRVVHYSDPKQVMFRGGSFMDPLAKVCCADRSLSELIDYASGSLGVRAVRSIDP
ncbi:MAG: SUMF1/EgtB/PvdO family nonheme iron enzyme [Planctomycetes bacterium]|jgi:serine/threonine protein kinase/formylglycine-generating enzyme required for sulfatase activity|nr:SUMF1/EgtB/PvdO family nonheme iron enzyme [Planctomycetota bacterium]